MVDEIAAGGTQTVDPSVAYTTVNQEPIINVYETLVSDNGSAANGSSAAAFLPLVATCVPGTPQCSTDYGAGFTGIFNQYGDEFTGSNGEPTYWTFVIDPAAHFYDPGNETGWPVYPTDVMFSIARTAAFSDLPAFATNPGWIQSQALLPGGNPNFDDGMHAPYNNTPYDVLSSMLINASAYCPASAMDGIHGDGCITFVADGSGQDWPEFLELMADGLGASVEPCGWYTEVGAGVPGFPGSGAPHGDGGCLLPGGVTSTDAPAFQTYLSSLQHGPGLYSWDAFENLSRGSPIVQPVVRSVMVGSGPYMASVSLATGYTLQPNPSYEQPSACGGDPAQFAQYTGYCDPAPGSFIPDVTVSWDATDAQSIAGFQAGTIDVGQIAVPNDTAELVALQADGDLNVVRASTLSIFQQNYVTDWSATARSGDDLGGTNNIPSDFFAYQAARSLLQMAYPYATIEGQVWTMDGVPSLEPVGGQIPAGLGCYSAPSTTDGCSNPYTVNFPYLVDSGAVDTNPSVVGSAGWWWAQGTTPSSPYYDPELAACTTSTPCEFSIEGFTGSPQQDAANLLWVQSIEAVTDYALRPNTQDLSSHEFVDDCLTGALGLNPCPIYNLGWIPDYLDPTDYEDAYGLPESSYGSVDDLSTLLVPGPFDDEAECAAAGAAYTGHTGDNLGSLMFWANASNSTVLPTACDGIAYGVYVWSLNAAAPLVGGTSIANTRVLLYDLGQSIANALDLYTWTGQQVTYSTAAPWIAPSSLNTNPLLGGAGDQLWFQLSYATPSAPPPSVTVGPTPGTPLYVDGNVYVPNTAGDTISVLSGATHQVVQTITVGTTPQTPVLDSGSGAIFVANFGSDNVTVINPTLGTDGLVVANLTVGAGPQPPVYNPGNGLIYVPNGNGGTVTVLSGTAGSYQVLGSVYVGSAPETPAVDTANGEVFVPNNGSDNVSVIPPATSFGMCGCGVTVAATIPVGTGPETPVFDTFTGDVYVPNYGSNNVSVISGSLNKVIATLGAGLAPLVVATPDGIGPTNRPLGFSRTTRPAPLINPVTGTIYVSNSGSGSVTVINGTATTVTTTVSVGSNPQPAVLDTATGQVLVANSGSDNVSVISGSTNTVVSTVNVGTAPSTPVFDPASGEVYVPNSGSGSVSVLPANYNLRFTEAGLPTGTSWSVTVSGSTETTTSGSLDFFEPIGSYAFSVGAVTGYVASPGLGGVTITSANVAIALAFAPPVPSYLLEFAEAGLPDGTPWSVTADGGTLSTTSSSVDFVVPDGTYSYAVGAVVGYSISSPAGIATVDGYPLVVSLVFTPETAYVLTFSESGLPTGTNWTVSVLGTEFTSSAAAQELAAPNGTYAYSIPAVPGFVATPASGVVAVNGGPTSVSVTFARTTSEVTFTETGLPSGRSWSVDLGGTLERSTGSSLTFAAPNGTLAAIVQGPAGYRSTGGGVVTVNGPTNFAVTFVKGKTVAAQFGERGLAAGQRWCVELLPGGAAAGIAGDAQCSSGKSLAFSNLTPGPYSYAVVSPLANQTITGRLGPVSGGSAGTLSLTSTQKVVFTFVYPFAVTFSESGLPSGTSWSVTVQGTTLSNATGGPIVVDLPNGTYHFRVASVPGYKTPVTSKRFMVHGSAVAVSVTYTAKRGGSPPLLPATLALGLGGLPAVRSRRSRPLRLRAVAQRSLAQLWAAGRSP